MSKLEGLAASSTRQLSAAKLKVLKFKGDAVCGLIKALVIANQEEVIDQVTSLVLSSFVDGTVRISESSGGGEQND